MQNGIKVERSIERDKVRIVINSKDHIITRTAFFFLLKRALPVVASFKAEDKAKEKAEKAKEKMKAKKRGKKGK